jgi:DNA-binding transcriptional LysR family regulator
VSNLQKEVLYLRVEQLEYLIGIYQTGSFSLAAEALHITQPTISQAMNSLESELGIKIFNRSRQGAEPTAEGIIVIKKAQEILSKVTELKEELNLRSASITGTLKLAIVPSVCSTLLPKSLAIYKKKYPYVHVEIVEEGSKDVINDLSKGNVDVGIIAIAKGTWDKNEDIQYEELVSTKVKVCVGRNFNLKKQSVISPSEILKHPIVMFKSGYNMGKFMNGILNDYGKMDILFTSDNTEIAKKVIVEGIAIGFFTELSLKDDPYLLKGDLIALDIKNDHKIVSIGWIQSKNRHFSKAAQEFIQVLKTQAEVFI